MLPGSGAGQRANLRRSCTMKKAVLFSSILLLAVTIAVAQQSYPSGTASSNQDQSATSQSSTNTSNSNSVQGCLSGSDGNFTLTDQSGNAWRLSGDSAKLSPHVGHTIAVTGKQSGASSATSSETGSSVSASGS